MRLNSIGAVGGSALASLCLIGCATTSLPSTPADSVVVEGYLSAGPGFVRLHPVRDEKLRSDRDCIQLLRPPSSQSEPIPEGRVRVTGRLGVFDDLFELAKLQVGDDQATHELCDARYLIVADIASASGN